MRDADPRRLAARPAGTVALAALEAVVVVLLAVDLLRGPGREGALDEALA